MTISRLISVLACIAVVTVHLADAQTQELILPIAVNGIVSDRLHFQTTYRMVNLSGSRINVSFEARHANGRETNLFRDVFCDQNPIPPPIATRTTFSLPPNAAVELVSLGGTPLFNGWVRLTYDASVADLLQASSEISLIGAKPFPCENIAVCQRPSSEVLASALVLAIKPAREFDLPATITPNRQTAVAIVNSLNTQSVKVTLSLLTAAGTPYLLNGNPVSRQFDLPPGVKLSAFLWEALTTCLPQIQPCLPTPPLPSPIPDMFHGSLKISSDLPVAVGALNVLFPEGKLVNLPIRAMQP